jgi:hypothetical protein
LNGWVEVAGSSALGGAVGGNTRAASALNEVANNYLSHSEAQAREKALQQKQACTTDECRQSAQKTINELNQLDTWRDAQIQTACTSPSSSLCQGLTSALQIAKTSYTNYDPRVDINGSVAGERSQVNSQAFQYQQRIDNPFAYGVGKGLLKLSPPGMVAGIGYGAYSLTSAILENGLEATAISIAKGIVDLPYELKARLNSNDPTVRGEALVDTIALGSSAAYLTQKLGLAVVNTADQAIAKTVAKVAEETAAAKAAAQVKIENNLYRDGGVIEYGKSKVSTNPNEAIFWSGTTSGVGGVQVAKQIAEKYKGSTLEQLIENRQIEMPKYNRNDPNSVRAWVEISQELAKNAAGEIKVSLGASTRPDNIWNSVELPTLKQNPAVTKIISIDPNTGIETLIFKR